MHRFAEAVRLLLVASVLVAAACSGDKARTDLPDWSDGFETGGPIAGGTDAVDGGSVVSQDGGAPPMPDSMTIAIPANVTWPMRIRNRDALSQPCEIPRDDPDTELVYGAEKKVECIIDSDELDLYVLGLQFNVVIPEGMCEYLLRVPYIFENFEVGGGPDRVAYTKNEDGTFTDEVNSEDGKPVCQYDYSRFDPDLPNCCYGEYTLEITSGMTGKTTTATKSWGGGELGKCYYGAGYVDERAAFDTAGFPVSEIIYSNRQPYVQEEVFDGVSDKYGSNVALANYYDPDDHGGDAPGALRGEFARPLYEYYCLDHAEENIAHISIVVREWNEEAEFDVDGNPDTLGTEPDWDLPRTDDINDVSDWKDYGDVGENFPFLPHL